MAKKRDEGASLCEYRGAEFAMRIPVGLRSSGRRYESGVLFTRPSNRSEKPGITSVAVVIEEGDLLEARRRELVRIRNSSEWMGTRTVTIRQGVTDMLPDGLELLVSENVSATGEEHHSYDASFRIDDRYITVALSGVGDILEFDKECKAVLLSIRLIEPKTAESAQAPQAMSARAKRKQRTKSGRGQQVPVPERLAYLAAAIAELEDFEPDTLGDDNPEAFDLVESAVRSRVRGMSDDDAQAAIAEDCAALQQWLENPTLAKSPAHFILGALLGMTMYADLDELTGGG